MLADFYIPRLSNDMKIAVQKNLGGQILNSQIFCITLYISLVPRKNGVFTITNSNRRVNFRRRLLIGQTTLTPFFRWTYFQDSVQELTFFHIILDHDINS